MPEPPDRMPPHRKQVERRRAVRGPTGTGSKEWVATGCAGIDVPGQRGTNWHGQRGTNWHGQRRDKRRRAGMGCTRMDGHEAKDGRARSKGTDGADSKGQAGMGCTRMNKRGRQRDGRGQQRGAWKRAASRSPCTENKRPAPQRRNGSSERSAPPPRAGGAAARSVSPS